MNPRPSNWHKSNRKAELGRDFYRARTIVKKRAAGRCEKMIAPGVRCPEVGTECHHVGDRLDHSPSNLAWVCYECHAKETQAQSQAAARLAADKLSHPSRRSGSKPPGLL